MGEAKRRRDYERAHADEITADLEQRRAHRALIDEIASEDPDDRACRLAHGFTRDDDWQDPTLLCRNGCGASYLDVVGGKIRLCRATRPSTPCPCGHLWLFHDIYEYDGDGSETCCVSGCDQVGCPGTVIRTGSPTVVASASSRATSATPPSA